MSRGEGWFKTQLEGCLGKRSRIPQLRGVGEGEIDRSGGSPLWRPKKLMDGTHKPFLSIPAPSVLPLDTRVMVGFSPGSVLSPGSGLGWDQGSV